MIGISEDIRIHRDMAETIDEDNISIRKVQKQTGQAILELSDDVTDNKVAIISLKSANSYLRRDIKRLRKQNNDLQKWLEGYIKLLFAIVVVFIIVVFVS
jgi:chaperonin cofactor prefoldin